MINYPLKIISANDDDFNVHFDEMQSFIENYSRGSQFALILNYGLISQGKSTFSQKISGFKHAIGDGIEQETKGAYLSYCGTVQNIIERFKIVKSFPIKSNLHVFNIDTEGIFLDKNEYITEFVFPLIQMSSVLIIYASSFTDLSILPIIEAIDHLTKIKILISFRDSCRIIKDDINSIDYYLDKARKSTLGRALESQNVTFEIIPGVDFRDIVGHDFSNTMNQYFISKILYHISFNVHKNSTSFIDKLQNAYSNQNKDFIYEVFAIDGPEDSILKGIQHKCLLILNEKLENIDENDISIYDPLSHEITSIFYQMCPFDNIENTKSGRYLKELLNIIKIKKNKAELNHDRKVKEERIINDKKEKKKKEKELVDFLSNEISNISNTTTSDLVTYIKFKQSSKLKSLPIEFHSKCIEIIATASPYIRKDMVNYIKKDITEIMKEIKKSSESAAELIDKKEEEEKKKKTKLIVQFVGFLVGSALTLGGLAAIGGAVCAIAGVPSLPINQIENPEGNVKTFKIGKKTLTINVDDIKNSVVKNGSNIRAKIGDLYDEFNKVDDFSIADSVPIFFEERDYSKYLNELNEKNDVHLE